MYPDANLLHDFYSGRLGQNVRRMLIHRLRARWRNVAGMTVAGLGYASPYLGVFRGEANRAIALVPAEFGPLRWPASGAIASTQMHEDALPLPDECVDRLLIVHCLEHSGALRPMLREAWRVLAPEGRMVVIAPNRSSLWSRRDTTPFGHGRPYSRAQLDELLKGAMFDITDLSFALHRPPFDVRALERWSVAIERLGARAWPMFGGLVMADATKSVSAGLPVGAHTHAQRAPLRTARVAGSWSRPGIEPPRHTQSSPY